VENGNDDSSSKALIGPKKVEQQTSLNSQCFLLTWRRMFAEQIKNSGSDALFKIT
jgi:hypothetical protein